jgi:hypothetical protein
MKRTCYKPEAGSSRTYSSTSFLPIRPIPDRCIWCLRDVREAPSDESHVLPECLGNAGQQTLPPGIVCTSCNNYFGRTVEPIFLRDPIVHVIASFLQIVDPGDQQAFRAKTFDNEHQPLGPVRRNVSLDLKLLGHRIELGVKSEISGTIVREYSHRDLGFLSRAVHKVAFESLAWCLYVKDSEMPAAVDVPDLFSVTFDAVRMWGREGQPMSHVRPVFRRPANTISPGWRVQHSAHPNGWLCELTLCAADWYAVSLTSPSAVVETHLREWTAAAPGPKWMIGDFLIPVQVS